MRRIAVRKPILAGAGPGLQTRRALLCIAGGFDPHWLPPISVPLPDGADAQRLILTVVAHDSKCKVDRPGVGRAAELRGGGPVEVRADAGEGARVDGGADAGFIVKGADFADGGETPVVVAGEPERFHIVGGLVPGERVRGGVPLPHEAGAEVGDGAIAVIAEGDRDGGHGVESAHAAGVKAAVAAGAEGFAAGMGARAAAGVDGPGVARGIGAGLGGPPVIGAGAGEEGGIEGGVDGVVVDEGDEFGGCGQTPVVKAGEGEAAAVGGGGFPGHFAAVGLLPLEAGLVVGDGAVAVGGEGSGGPGTEAGGEQDQGDGLHCIPR